MGGLRHTGGTLYLHSSSQEGISLVIPKLEEMGMGQLDLSLKNMFKSMVEGPNSLYYDVSFKT